MTKKNLGTILAEQWDQKKKKKNLKKTYDNILTFIYTRKYNLYLIDQELETGTFEI